MTQDEMVEAVRNATISNRLDCEKAHALAKDLNVPLRQIGLLCNELKIKIAACQLGCF